MAKKKYNTNLGSVKNIILSLVVIVCLALDFWAVYIKFWGKEKVNSYIFKVGTQTATAVDPTTGEITTEDRWFCEVNIYDNCYEILFNYFTDDTKTDFYSQGLQFYLDDPKNSLENSFSKNYYYDMYGTLKFNYDNGENKPIMVDKSIFNPEGVEKEKTEIDSDFSIFGVKIYERKTITKYFYNILTNKSYSNVNVTNFASANKYEDAIISSNPLDENSYFYIDMGEEKPYLMKLKGSDYDYLSANSEEFFLTEKVEYDSYWNNAIYTRENYYYNNVSYYRSCDIQYFAELIYNSCLGLNYTNTAVVIDFEFDNIFNYYDENGEKIVNESICDKIRNHVKSYYQIKVEKHQGNMTKASQSLFKTFKHSENYDEDLAEDSGSVEIFTDYHHGRTILDIDENFFKVNLIEDSSTEKYKMYLAVDKDFINKYPASSGYRLRVNINLDNLNYSTVEFAGLVKGTLDDYFVYKVLTTQTIDGEIITTDITKEVE